MQNGRIEMLSVRGVESELWTAVRTVALREGVSAGELLNTILRDWLERQASTGRAPGETPC